MNIQPRRPAMAIASAMVLLGAALLALEAAWPPVAWWSFVVLSLTVGFGHGALDALLLLGQFTPRSKALGVSVAYLACVLLAGWLLSLSMPLALLVLLLMSVWHFGELYGDNLWVRLCAGGASVMWPMLVAQGAMAPLLQTALGDEFTWIWQAWRMLAIGWLGLVCTALVVYLVQRLRIQKNRSNNPLMANKMRVNTLCAAAEIGALLCAYLLLSPLLAFAVYFGLYHCLAHIARVRRALAVHSAQVFSSGSMVLLASALATALLLGLLWWVLLPTQWLGATTQAQVMRWLIVSLAAVTLPHMLLVSYSARWLGR